MEPHRTVSARTVVDAGVASELAALAWRPSGSPDGRAAAAMERLRDAHRAQARPDLRRVHPSWLRRALQDESPAVRCLILARGIDLGDGRGAWAGAGDSPAEAAVAWACSLWTERLVGGEPPDPSEPAAILALTDQPPSDVFRLAFLAGVAKAALAGDPQGWLADRPAWREHAAWFRSRFDAVLGDRETRPRAWAARELPSPGRTPSSGKDAEISPRRSLASLGLVSLARLLVACDPHRVRWALQHLPYPVAKRMRGLMAAAGAISPGVSDIELLILEAARARLRRQPSAPTARVAPDREAEHAD
ncbi:hypothetical protein [Aquisphaera insulae]|uniref:hypothetical protein n=1 Tax=Aquisphaera insulae TaxID=2712864 RepID=UPI0013EC739E|nr:hypothetical protein [Aquisphaera insulae]